MLTTTPRQRDDLSSDEERHTNERHTPNVYSQGIRTPRQEDDEDISTSRLQCTQIQSSGDEFSPTQIQESSPDCQCTQIQITPQQTDHHHHQQHSSFRHTRLQFSPDDKNETNTMPSTVAKKNFTLTLSEQQQRQQPLLQQSHSFNPPNTPVQDEDADDEQEWEEENNECLSNVSTLVENKNDQDVDNVLTPSLLRSDGTCSSKNSFSFTFENDCISTVADTETENNVETEVKTESETDADTVVGDVLTPSLIRNCGDYHNESFGNDDCWNDSDTWAEELTKSPIMKSQERHLHSRVDAMIFSAVKKKHIIEKEIHNNLDLKKKKLMKRIEERKKKKKNDQKKDKEKEQKKQKKLDNNMKDWIESINHRKIKIHTKNKQSENYSTNNLRNNEDEESISEFSPQKKYKDCASTTTNTSANAIDTVHTIDSIERFDGDSDYIEEFDKKESRSTAPSSFKTTHQPRSLKLSVASSLSQKLSSTNSLTSSPTCHTSAILHNHQSLAVKWMLSREGQSDNKTTAPLAGGILADECGLGKTISALTLICSSNNNGNSSNDGKRSNSNNYGGTLIICPTSCIEQWCREIRTKTSLTCLSYYGKRRNFKISNNPYNLTQYDIVITNYNTVVAKEKYDINTMKNRIIQNKGMATNGGWMSRKKSTEKKHNSVDTSVVGQSCLHCVDWYRVIADEVHEIKNKRTNRYKCVNDLSSNFRWGMTATPISNHKKELETLLQWVSGAKKSSSDLVLRESEITRCCSNEDRNRSIPKYTVVMLRRTKNMIKKINNSNDDNDNDDTIQLPQLTYQTIECTMEKNGIQYAIYKKLYQKMGCLLRKNKKQRKKQLHIFELLLRLRQAANHPTLIVDSVNKGSKKLRHALQSKSSTDDGCSSDDDFENNKNTFSKNTIARPRSRDGCKLKKLLILVRKYRNNNDKFIIFSQWTTMLNICQSALDARGYNILSLNGNLSLDDRDKIIRKCKINKNKNKVDGLLVSMKCGGSGLNLTCFNKIIIMEPHYNPIIEEQAIGRVYRIGNKFKSIEIIRLITKNTIEMNITKMQKMKKMNIDSLLKEKRLQNDHEEEEANGDQELLNELIKMFRRG